MKKQERFDRTLEMLDSRNFMSISELANIFEVSEMTIRRDLWELDASGKVRLVYGGVTSLNKEGMAASSYTVDAEQVQHTEEKRRIAQMASTLIAPDDVVFLDSGTTVQYLAECLPPEGAYTFICYSLNTINVISRLPNSSLIAPGGIFSQKSQVFSGPNAVSAMKKYRANKAFIGATGYEIKHGLTCAFVEDSALKEAAIEASVERILLLDSSKFGLVSTCSFADLESFNRVITDAGVSSQYLKHLQAKVAEVVTV